MRVHGQGPSTDLTNSGPPTEIAGEYLDDLATELFGGADFGHRSATGAVGDLATVAHFCDIGVQERADDEFRPVGDIDAGGRRVDHGADAHDHARIRFGEVPRDVEENMGREIAAIGELDAFGAAVGAGLDDLLTNLGVGMIKDRDHALIHHRR